jgi:hypothetical protein
VVLHQAALQFSMGRFVSLHLQDNKLGKIADDIQCACSMMEVRRVPLSWVGSLLGPHYKLT